LRSLRDKAGAAGAAASSTPEAFEGNLDMLAKSVGKKRLIGLIRYEALTDSRLKQIVDEWDEMPAPLRSRTPLKALVSRAGLSEQEFFLAAASAAYDTGNPAALIIAALQLPAIMEASVRRALDPQGVKDRRMQLEHAGLLPTPRGTQTVVNKQAFLAQQNAGKFGWPNFAEQAKLRMQIISRDVEEQAAIDKADAAEPNGCEGRK